MGFKAFDNSGEKDSVCSCGQTSPHATTSIQMQRRIAWRTCPAISQGVVRLQKIRQRYLVPSVWQESISSSLSTERYIYRKSPRLGPVGWMRKGERNRLRSRSGIEFSIRLHPSRAILAVIVGIVGDSRFSVSSQSLICIKKGIYLSSSACFTCLTLIGSYSRELTYVSK